MFVYPLYSHELMNDFLFKDEGYQLIGAALEVYNEQGHHLSEDIYQASLEAELQRRKIPYDPQFRLDVYYKGTLEWKRLVL